MHFFRNIFNAKFEASEKFIHFVIIDKPKNIPEGGRNEEDKEKKKKKTPETNPEDNADKKPNEPREELAKIKTQVDAGQLKEDVERGYGDKVIAKLDNANEGVAKDYLEAFDERTMEFQTLVATLESGINAGAPFANFETWTTTTPQSAIADFWENYGYFPTGKGKNAFIEGLRTPVPKLGETGPEVDKHMESRKILEQIVLKLRTRFNRKNTGMADITSQKEKGPFGETVDKGLKTLMRNYSRSSGTEKMLIIGAIGIGVILLNKLRSKPIFKGAETTYQDAFMWLGALWGMNYISGKVSPDGRTIVQRFDIGRELDDLKDNNEFKGYAEKHKMGEDQEKFRAFETLLSVDLKKLYEGYKEVGGPTSTKKEINPQSLGLRQNQIDGKDAYELVETLIKETSVNENMYQFQKAKKEGRIPQNEIADISKWTDIGVATKIFEEKYIMGDSELSKLPLKYADAVLNEFNTKDARIALARGRDDALYARVGRGLGGAASVLAVEAWGAMKKGGELVWKGGKMGYEAVRDHVAIPLGTGTAYYYDKYAPKIGNAISNTLGLKERSLATQEVAVNEVLSPNFGCDVVENEKATLMGYPGIKIEFKKDKSDKKIIVIDGIEFSAEKGIPGNKAGAQLLENKITEKTDLLLKAQSGKLPALAGKKPQWNIAEKKWEVKGVALGGNALLGIAANTGTLKFTINPDSKSLKLFVGDKEITNFTQLDTVNRDAIIQEKVWKVDGAAEKYLRSLDVQVLKVEPNATHRALISGKIAGLAFQAVMKPGSTSINDGLLFFDGKLTGGAEKLAITEKNGGTEFLDAVAGKILIRGEYLNAFQRLEQIVDGMDDSAWGRIKELFPTTRLWIIPTSLNVPAAINGKILHRQWKFMLDYKKMETLEFFKQELRTPSATVKDIAAADNKVITNALNHLEDLAKNIESANKDEQSERFQEYLSGMGDPGKKASGLEFVNYPNKDYRKLFNEYQKVITNDKYNYPGLESIGDAKITVGGKSVGGTDEAFEIYQVLTRVWSYHTRRFAVSDPLAANPLEEIIPDNQRAIRNGVIERVRANLDRAAAIGSGTIRLANLPPHETDADLDAWVDKSWTPSSPRPAQGARWTGSGAISTYIGLEARGKVSKTESREARDPEGPIKPTPENLDAIRAELKKVFTETFPTRYSTKYSAEFAEKYERLLLDLPEGLLAQAITENGSEKALLSKFVDELKTIRSEVSNESEIISHMGRFFKWLVDNKKWDLPGENPNMQGNIFKPRHKMGLSIQLTKLEAYYKARLEKEHKHWYGDNYNEEKIKFLDKVELPFYREFYMNKAIVENHDENWLADNYSEFLKLSLRECIEDRADRTKQEADDRSERAARVRDIEWTERVVEMHEVRSH